MLRFLKLSFQGLRSHFWVNNVRNSGKNYLSSPFRVCDFKAITYLLEDILNFNII